MNKNILYGIAIILVLAGLYFGYQMYVVNDEGQGATVDDFGNIRR